MIKLKVNEHIYYKNKLAFKRMYKSLNLVWEENPKTGDGWYNKDKSSYLLKLPEKEGFKRFYAVEVQGMVDFLKGIGAEDITKEDMKGTEQTAYQPEERWEFVGADLDSSSRRKFQEMLKALPSNFTCFYGDTLDYSNTSNEFKVRWRNLQRKYANYTFNDFLAEIRAKNVRSADDDVVVTAKRKVDDDILPSNFGTKKKSSKKKEVKRNPVKVSAKPQVEFKKKVFTITVKKKE